MNITYTIDDETRPRMHLLASRLGRNPGAVFFGAAPRQRAQ
jgi:hypothetical protein